MELGEEGGGGALVQARAIPYIDMTDHLQMACHMCLWQSHSGSHHQCGKLTSLISVAFLLKGLPSEKQKQVFSDISQVANWRVPQSCSSIQKSYGEWLQIVPWATLVGFKTDWNLGTSHPQNLSGLNNLISHPFLLFSSFSKKGCLQQAPTVHTHRKDRGKCHLAKAEV